MAEPTLSSLPETVLVHLFQMLPMSDRGHLACCSRSLSAAMHHPSLWTSVTLDLDVHVHAVRHGFLSVSSHMSVDRLCARDRTMIMKYGQYFRSVKINKYCARTESQSLDVLAELCQRHVVKSVSLRLDLFPSKTELRGINMCESFPKDMFASNQAIQPTKKPPSFGDLIERLSPETDITVQFPHDGWELHAMKCVSRMFLGLKSEKCCFLMKRLILSAISISSMEPFNLLFNTTQLVSRLPNLQELHLSIFNLSEQLLLELSAAKRKQSPLKNLGISYVNFKRTAHFPPLSSSAWSQLAKASPSLTVECRVVTDDVSNLDDVIKPETPLVRLTVVCCIRAEEGVKRTMYQLCEQLNSSLHVELCICENNMNVMHAKPERQCLKTMMLDCGRMQHLWPTLTLSKSVTTGVCVNGDIYYAEPGHDTSYMRVLPQDIGGFEVCWWPKNM